MSWFYFVTDRAHSTQGCSCFFISGRTVVYKSHYKRPQFPLKVDFGGSNYRLEASHVASHVDWPSRTLLMVRPARQNAVLLRCMTTTALVLPFSFIQKLFMFFRFKFVTNHAGQLSVTVEWSHERVITYSSTGVAQKKILRYLFATWSQRSKRNRMHS